MISASARNIRSRIVIIGAGFGGLSAAKQLAQAPVDVTIVDRHNYHLFQPLLYQVATAGLSPGDIASPIRAILHRQKNAHVSAAGIRLRWEAGYADTSRALERRAWDDECDPLEGVILHEQIAEVVDR